MRRLRVYSETAPYEEVTADGVLRALAVRNVELVLAVRPWDLRALGETARRIEGAGVALALWPMLADDDGRFLHVGNVARMRALALTALDAARSANATPADVMLDLEPPVSAVRKATHGAFAEAALVLGRGMRMHDAAARAVAGVRSALEREDVTVSAAVSPQALWDGPAGALSRLIGTVGARGFSSIDVMSYTTLFETFTFGVLNRQRSLRLLAAIAARAARADAHVRVALGCIGTGALGDEPVFADPQVLAEDARVARSHGAPDIALLDLGGALARPPWERWLDAVLD